MEPSNQKRAKLVGYDNFVRSNPLSDKFGVQSFHHLEFVAGDAGLTASAWCTARTARSRSSTCATATCAGPTTR